MQDRPTRFRSFLPAGETQRSLRSHVTIASLVLIGLAILMGARYKPGFARAFQHPGASPGAAEAKPHPQPVADAGGHDEAAHEYRTNASAPAVTGAAAANVQLSTDATWLFGSKTQRGWLIYIPLICNEIDTDADVSTAEFAQAVARWQRQDGLAANGILDSQTWSAMVRDFQSQRIKDRTYPSASDLVTAPASDFYDPDRLPELRQVRRDAYEAYRQMLAAAAADSRLGVRLDGNGDLVESDQYMRIISAFRSREYQDQLRKQSPKSGRAGLAVNSPHFTGRALDLYVGGEPVNTRDDNRLLQTGTPIYRWLVKNAARFGFRPYFYEPWHWEYCPDRQP